MRKKITILSLLSIVLLTSGFGCKVVDKETKEAMQPITLNYWRVWDGPDAFDEIIAKYRELHPFVTINYKKLRYNEYEQELLNALAEDRGPDIFSIHNTWVRKYENKIEPMPDTITMAYPVVKGSIKKEVIPELRTTKSITLKELKNNFVDAVAGDVLIKVKDETSKEMKDKVFGLPLSVDTLAMFYNKDLLNNAGIPEPPAYWNREFQQDIKKLTKQDLKGQIVQSGIALGGSTNVERASDILSALMMQNGSEMLNDYGQVTFDKIPAALDDHNYNPGLEALRFYSDFANPGKEVYCWNGQMDNSIKMFAEGRLAMMLGYSYHIPEVKAQNPKLNFSIAPLPQIEGNTKNVNLANYWVETVSNKSKYKNEAWDFIQFAAKAEQVKTYLAKTNKPTALRSLVSEQLDDIDLGIFASQVLTAKSWYKGSDANVAEKIINEMIDMAVSGQQKLEEVIRLSAAKVQQTIGN